MRKIIGSLGLAALLAFVVYLVPSDTVEAVGLVGRHKGAADAAAADIHEPAANTAAVVTYAAVAATQHVVSGICYSYLGGAPTGGNLKIESPAATKVFSLDIKIEDGECIYFDPPKLFATNTAAIVTLAAGGAGVSGKVSVLGHWTEP